MFLLFLFVSSLLDTIPEKADANCYSQEVRSSASWRKFDGPLSRNFMQPCLLSEKQGSSFTVRH